MQDSHLSVLIISSQSRKFSIYGGQETFSIVTDTELSWKIFSFTWLMISFPQFVKEKNDFFNATLNIM